MAIRGGVAGVLKEEADAVDAILAAHRIAERERIVAIITHQVMVLLGQGATYAAIGLQEALTQIETAITGTTGGEDRR